jgi:TonB family protein
VIPRSLHERRTAGLIVIEGIVTRAGTLRDQKVLRGAGDPCTPYVLAAVRQWRFKPGRRKGRAVEVIDDMTVNIDVR